MPRWHALEQEAAKAYKWTRAEEEALKFVTLNPANCCTSTTRRLPEGGKTDVVVWSDPSEHQRQGGTNLRGRRSLRRGPDLAFGGHAHRTCTPTAKMYDAGQTSARCAQDPFERIQSHYHCDTLTMKTAKHLLQSAYTAVLFSTGPDRVGPTPCPGPVALGTHSGGHGHLGTGDVLEDCAVGFRNGEIDYVGRSFQVNRQKYDDIVDATTTLYPGFIVTNTTGVAGNRRGSGDAGPVRWAPSVPTFGL